MLRNTGLVKFNVQVVNMPQSNTHIATNKILSSTFRKLTIAQVCYTLLTGFLQCIKWLNTNSELTEVAQNRTQKKAHETSNLCSYDSYHVHVAYKVTWIAAHISLRWLHNNMAWRVRNAIRAVQCIIIIPNRFDLFNFWNSCYWTVLYQNSRFLFSTDHNKNKFTSDHYRPAILLSSL